MKKSGKLAYHVVNSNNAVNSLPKVQISQGFVAFENNYVFSVSGEDLYHRCFTSVYYVRTVNRSPILMPGLQTILVFKKKKQGSLSSFRLLTGWGLHKYF
jgi:hypothetical protein